MVKHPQANLKLILIVAKLLRINTLKNLKQTEINGHIILLIHVGVTGRIDAQTLIKCYEANCYQFSVIKQRN
ncbi:hypothetical protein T4D_12107 [Trichinella pseudospiralis]|uniref:Uncharacterized protein n=1 Tax=Trichinella pseudospiralis TaxID=6337 RepID=A0A0V1G5V8_TRIPS|nr:hypothetical protein T4D_12107 [Trichinella pseudospiralis]